MSRYSIIRIGLIILFLLLPFINPFSKKEPTTKKVVSSPPKTSIATSSAKVVRVIDGDTVELETKQKVRYVGMDTPELHHPKKPVQCFAQVAYEKNKELVEGKIVKLEKDVSETDKYGRLLRYVYLPQQEKETTSSGLMINDYLVRQGYAYATTFTPDIKYQDQFLNAQREARENNRGLWNKCQ